MYISGDFSWTCNHPVTQHQFPKCWEGVMDHCHKSRMKNSNASKTWKAIAVLKSLFNLKGRQGRICSWGWRNYLCLEKAPQGEKSADENAEQIVRENVPAYSGGGGESCSLADGENWWLRNVFRTGGTGSAEGGKWPGWVIRIFAWNGVAGNRKTEALEQEETLGIPFTPLLQLTIWWGLGTCAGPLIQLIDDFWYESGWENTLKKYFTWNFKKKGKCTTTAVATVKCFIHNRTKGKNQKCQFIASLMVWKWISA